MPTIGSVTKTIRIAPRDLEVIEGLMADGTSWSGAIHKLCSENRGSEVGTPEKSKKISEASPKELEEIESMAVFWGISADELLKGVYAGLEDGNLTYEGRKIVGVPELELENLYDVCHERGIEPQTAINKLVTDMRKGK